MIWSFILCFLRCLNLNSVKFLFSAMIVLLWATSPNVKIIFKFFILLISDFKNTLHFFNSNELGLLLGGKHFTAFVILHFVLLVSWNFAWFCKRLYFFKIFVSKFPEKSPLKTSPVLFAPRNPGAKPIINSSLENGPVPKTLLL